MLISHSISSKYTSKVTNLFRPFCRGWFPASLNLKTSSINSHKLSGQRLVQDICESALYSKRSYCTDNRTKQNVHASSSLTSGEHNDSAALLQELTIYELTAGNMEATIKSQLPVLIEVYLPTSEVSMEFDAKLREKVTSMDGTVRLARLNAAIEHDVVYALRVSSVPTLLGIFNGQKVLEFVGSPSEQEFEQIFDTLLRTASAPTLHTLLSQANSFFDNNNIDEAIEAFNTILHEPSLKAEALALAGLVRCFIKKGDIEDAKELFSSIEASYSADLYHPEVLRARSALELATQSFSGEDLATLQQYVKDNPNDLEAHFNLSQQLWAASKSEEAINCALELVKKDKKWNEQAARKLLLKYWETLGPENPLTIKSRKRFSIIWF